MRNNKTWTKDELIDFKKRYETITVLVNVQIESHQVALDLTETHRILNQVEKFSVMDCVCRSTLGNCEFPKNVCLSLNEAAERIISSGRGRSVTKKEAKDIVNKTHELGLVHLALYPVESDDQNPSLICSCCSCCCHALQGLQLMNMKGLVKPSAFISTIDQNNCSQCGTCVDRCQFNARSWSTDGGISLDQDQCFGCGLCVTTCPEDSIQLVKR